MATTPTPFAAATAGDVGGPTASAEATGLSSKMMSILILCTVLAIVLIAIFVMNIVWCGSSSAGSTDDAVAGDAEATTETDASKTSPSCLRDYFGVVVSSVMLFVLMPGFYYANAVGKIQ